MLDIFKKLFIADDQSKEVFDVEKVIQHIRTREAKQNIPLGKRIHSSRFKNFDLFLDRDITKNYRITVFLGRDRMYSFSIFAQQGDYAHLEKGYQQIITFLKGERALAELPDNKIVKGFFYGH